jgi:hypothetical protein
MPHCGSTGYPATFPIVCARVRSPEEYTKAESLIKRHALLSFVRGELRPGLSLRTTAGIIHKPVRTHFSSFSENRTGSLCRGQAGIHLIAFVRGRFSLISTAAVTVDLGSPAQAIRMGRSPLSLCLPLQFPFRRYHLSIAGRRFLCVLCRQVASAEKSVATCSRTGG